jgi:hypothetical protein
VHPAVLEAYGTDALDDAWRGARQTSRMERSERAALHILQAG